jgi:hypothetical protein
MLTSQPTLDDDVTDTVDAADDKVPGRLLSTSSLCNANIWLDIIKISGCCTSQLQICNLFDILSNCAGSGCVCVCGDGGDEGDGNDGDDGEGDDGNEGIGKFPSGGGGVGFR